jgi:hypothetical protein
VIGFVEAVCTLSIVVPARASAAEGVRGVLP